MKNTLLQTLIIVALLLSAACSGQQTRLRQDQVVQIAWNNLAPSTSSQNRDNWVVVESRRVAGREVVEQFANAQLSLCPGPPPPENHAIRAVSEYWFIRTRPAHLANPDSQSGVVKDNIEAPVPEPLIKEALFLIEPFTGNVIARKIYCVEKTGE
jgi:hypothetical protein